MMGEGVQDYLKDIGREVASSLGEELKGVAKDKATAFVKEQFGLGFKEELQSAGREILSSVGDELKGAARDKATAFIKDQFGLGFKEELQSAGKKILSSVGDELKGAAKEKATAFIKEQLGLGMPMHSGGASSLQLCAHRITGLRKAANEFKRKLRKLSTPDFLLLHAPWKDARQLAVVLLPFEKRPSYTGFIDIATVSKRQGGLTMAQKNKLCKGIMQDLHPQYSRMDRNSLEQYIWTIADQLNVNWEPLLGTKEQKKRIGRQCESSKEVGDGQWSPPQARKKRKPSAYNLHVQQYMRANPDGDVRERFAAAVADWNRKKARSASSRQAAQTRRNRAEARREGAERRRRQIEANKQRAAAEYVERGRDPKVAAIRRSKVPKKKQAGRGALYDSWSESE